ncbi:MAG: glycosyltransferase [Thermodesulfobacteriota bacterium]
MRTRPSFSLCMIVRDEAGNLPRSLGPVAGFFDEAVIVDTGSTDGTPELARSYGARVLRIEWPGDFAAARNVSLGEASGDWIMWLDADNQVSPEGVERLRALLDPAGRAVLWCTEVVVPAGERLIQKRVFPRRPEVYFAGRVHEQLVHPADYRSVLAPVEILHWGYADKAAARAKGERNLGLLFEMARENPDDPYLCYQVGRTLLNLRRFDEARTWLEKSARSEAGPLLNPGLHAHVHILLARALERLDRPAEAEKVLAGLTAARADYGPGHYALGRLKYARREYAAAAESFQTFLRLGAGDPVAGFNPRRMYFTAAMLLGRCFEEIGKPVEADRAYTLAARSDPVHPEPPLAQARLALNLGRREEAAGYLSRCLKVAPGHRRAAALLEEAGLG